MNITPETLRDLAESPALDPVLTWDGERHYVGSRHSHMNPNERIVLTRDALGDFLLAEGGDWEDQTDEDYDLAAGWLNEHGDEWLAGEVA